MADPSLPVDLSSSPFLSGIPEPYRGQLRAIAVTRSFPSRTVLFQEGAVHPELHVVLAGNVQLEMNVPERGRVPILSIGPGDVLAWSALTGGGVMTATATATLPVTTAAFNAHELQQLCTAEPEIGFYVMQQLARALSRRLLGTRLQLLDLFAIQVPVTGASPGDQNATG